MRDPSANPAGKMDHPIKNVEENKMAVNDAGDRRSLHDMEAHERTFRGFILLLEVTGGLSALTLLLMFLFLTH